MGTAIIIAANGFSAETTAKCLDALHRYTTDFRVYLEDRLPSEELSACWNRGARWADELSLDTICYLNNDTQVHKGWLPPLLEVLDHCTAAGPVTNNPGHQPLQQGTPDEPARHVLIPWAGGEVGHGKALNGFCFVTKTERALDTEFDQDTWKFLGSEDYWMHTAYQAYQLPFAIARHSYVHHEKAYTRSRING